MELFIHKINGTNIAEIISADVVIENVQDALNIMTDAFHHDAQKIIINKKNIVPDFFKLKNGLAGEILQKFVNYNIQFAITGDFSEFKSKSLHSFIAECNRGNQFFFVGNSDAAIGKLVSN